MKLKLPLSSSLALAGCVLAGQASAQACGSGTLVTDPAATFSGKTVCAMRGAERWQEYHDQNGDVIDYKLGQNHPVDPSEKVGTWQAFGSPTSTITYNYGTGGTYVYSVYQSGGIYNFCSVSGSGDVLGATLIPNQVKCP